MPTTKTEKTKTNGANLDFAEKLWAAADKLRGHMDAAEFIRCAPSQGAR